MDKLKVSGLALLALLGAFAAGRYSRPAKVVTKTETKTVYQDRVVEKRVEVKGEDRIQDRIVYRDRSVVNHPDGTIEHRDIERTDNRTADETTDATAASKSEQTEKLTLKTESKTVTRDNPRWDLSLSFGAPIELHSPVFGVPFGIVDLSYRLVGPFSVGVWGSLDVKGQNPAAGASVGVSF